MGLSDEVYETFQILIKQYKNTYRRDGEYPHIKTLENLLVVLLKSIYIMDKPNHRLESVKIPTDEAIRAYIQELLVINDIDDSDDDS